MTAEHPDHLSYSHRVCRRCGTDLHRVHRRWLGDAWRCPNGGRHRASAGG